jgi:hypothetical protein
MDTDENIQIRASVLDCGSPWPLFHCETTAPESASGLAHSKTLR